MFDRLGYRTLHLVGRELDLEHDRTTLGRSGRDLLGTSLGIDHWKVRVYGRGRVYPFRGLVCAARRWLRAGRAAAPHGPAARRGGARSGPPRRVGERDRRPV